MRFRIHFLHKTLQESIEMIDPGYSPNYTSVSKNKEAVKLIKDYHVMFHDNAVAAVKEAIRRHDIRPRERAYQYPVVVPEEYSLEQALKITQDILKEEFSYWENVHLRTEDDPYNFFFIAID